MRNTIQSRPSVSTIENLSTQSSYLLNQPRNSASMLVVIDPRVEDYAMLAAGVHEGANVFILDLNRDGVEQITEALAQHPASTLHIVSHGSPGCLAVGNTYLSLENLDRYADDLQTWSIFLSSASVFLYACNVAAGELGEAFLSKLHQLTGANIAASANPTGSALKGGDWELEVIIGKIEASLAFPEVVREAYTSVLVISITPLTGISLTEGGDSQTLAVGIDLGIDPVLNTPIATLADATITLTPDAQLDLGNGAGNPFNVIIPAGSTAATITNVAVRGVNDNVTEGNHTGTITATITSTNPILNALPGVNLTTTISDPSLPPAPVPLISITPLTGISLTEGGDSQTLAVGIDLGIDPVLNTPIATLADATITLTPDAQLDLGNGAGNPFNVIIPAGSTAATITNVAVRGVNDNVTEGNHTGTITATITSTNPILNALPGVNLTTTISDPSLPPAPVPLISITPLTGISLTEGGDSQTLAVGIDLGIDPVLNTPIATLADATITLTPDAQLDLGNGAGNPFNVIIPAGSTAATITNVAVRGVNDNVTEGNHTGTITATITSTNPILNALPGVNLTTTISDPSLPPAPVPLISITPLTGISLTEGGDSQTLAVGIDLGIDPVLNTPIATLADATITLTPDAQLDLGNGAGNPFNVIIPAGSTAATITNVAVRGVNDNVTEGNHTGTITATITSTNPILNALPGVNLTTTISDPLVTNPPATGGTGGTGTPGNPDIPGGTGGSGNGGTSGTPSAIAPLLIQNPNDFFTVQGPTGQQVILDFDLGSINTSFIDEIGVYTVDNAQGTINGIAPGAAGYLQAARNNAQPIFSVLPDINRLLPNADLLRNLSFEAGTNLGFYLVQNGTASDGANIFFGSPSANPNSTDYLQVSPSGDGSFSLGWRDQSGNQSFDNVVLSARATTQTSLPVGTQLQQTTGLELIDVLTQANQSVDFNFNIASEAAYNNSVGLYKVENAQGTILDELTRERLNPGDANYAQVALRQSKLNSELGSNRSASGLQQLDGGAIYAPYLIANGTRDRFLSSNSSNQTAQGREGQVPLAYFAFQGANPDKVDHIRQLGNNTFGFEDLLGGGDRDFNDIVVKTDLTVRT